MAGIFTFQRQVVDLHVREIRIERGRAVEPEITRISSRRRKEVHGIGSLPELGESLGDDLIVIINQKRMGWNTGSGLKARVVPVQYVRLTAIDYLTKREREYVGYVVEVQVYDNVLGPAIYVAYTALVHNHEEAEGGYNNMTEIKNVTPINVDATHLTRELGTPRSTKA